MPLRLVLDTNVWLDWLVFDDPGVAPIRAGVAEHRFELCIDAACCAELERVLGYPLLPEVLPAAAQSERLTHARSHALWFTRETVVAPASLPTCRDRDDQKFLELARDCGAGALITKDLALLELNRRRHALPFRVLTPLQFGAPQSA